MNSVLIRMSGHKPRTRFPKVRAYPNDLSHLPVLGIARDTTDQFSTMPVTSDAYVYMTPTVRMLGFVLPTPLSMVFEEAFSRGLMPCTRPLFTTAFSRKRRLHEVMVGMLPVRDSHGINRILTITTGVIAGRERACISVRASDAVVLPTDVCIFMKKKRGI